MKKIYFKKVLALTESEYDTLYSMLAGYHPSYLDYEDIDKEEKKDWENAMKIRGMFGVKRR